MDRGSDERFAGAPGGPRRPLTDERSGAIPFRTMNALLDTCALLWAARQPERLLPPARAAARSPHGSDGQRLLSAWEIALKAELGIDDVARWFREAARHLHARIQVANLHYGDGLTRGERDQRTPRTVW